ncbi:MAG: MoxR family ATPase [Proteobacteria bacterium]|jgi:MoxR-like ATPase|nr:MoxR family ATPase [Pseudomonadota bacterium]
MGQQNGVSAAIDRLRSAICTVVWGKGEVVDLALTTVLAGGHLLIQDVPGVGKTTLAAALAAALGGSFARVQFTSDLLPGDITGVNVLQRGTGDFRFRAGPLFANVVLADEINRTSPKTQSALFEAMEEGQVTVDGKTRPLPRPFMVVATQNPFDFHGTFPLPDSQLDRFMMRVSMGYPDRDAERIVIRQGSQRQMPETVIDSDEVLDLGATVEKIAVPKDVEEYLLDLIRLTREDPRLLRGVSTRGGQALFRAVRAYAVVAGRDFAIPEDVRRLAVPVLGHRVLPRTGGGPAGEGGPVAIAAMLDNLPSPV